MYVLMKNIKKLICAAAVLAVLCFSVGAVQFTDVADNAWYKNDVDSVCNDGYMNGVGDNKFSPDSTFTVAQGITVAARLCAAEKGEEIKTDGAKTWYTPYVDYAISKGIIKDGQFNSYEREITRAEMALLFANAVDKNGFTKINNVTQIPDVDERESYADTLVMLYNAGVLSGSDEYGYFYPNNSIKRSEASAIINRTANKGARKSFTLKDTPKDVNAYYLIDNQSMSANTRGIIRLASSWNYENRFDASVNNDGSTTNVLKDSSGTGYVSINRHVKTTSEGVLTLVSSFTIDGITDVNGVRIYLENTDGKNVFEICTENDIFNVKSDKTYPTTQKAINGTYHIKAVLDLDNKKGTLAINGVNACDFALGDFKDISRIYYSTTDISRITFTPTFTQMYVNYLVNDTFFEGAVPYDYNGEASIKEFANSRDIYSLELNKTGKVTKSFSKTSGKVRFESYFYMPNAKDSAYISLDNGQNSAVKVNISGDSIKAGDISHSFKNHIWQCVVIEADTNKGVAVIYVNGKNKGTVLFTSQAFDGITLGFDKKEGSVYFDDIKVNAVYDYPDYCPTPKKVNSENYILIMSVCSLWREGTHSGWDFVSPYEECSPVWGYYDEGIPEEMDWEIKYMAEHGIDAMQFCWYTSQNEGFNTPEKNPRLVWALNDGYMYARYSNMVDFAILWEAANFKNAKITLEQFESYIWDYWVEWYLRDSRYMTINNKAVIQIYDPQNFITAIGGEAVAKKAVDFMREDIKNYGYDGLILLASDDCKNVDFVKQLSRIGFDGAGAYGWDKNVYEPDYHNSLNQRGFDNTLNVNGFSYLPTVSAGKNIMGWENTRTPMATPNQHASVLEYTKALLKEQGKAKGNEWQDKTVYFSTWNEFGEGHWLAPDKVTGFGYMDEYLKAFTNAPAHNDTSPTIKQMERICRLYNNERQPIRPLLHEDYTTSADISVLKEIKFDTDASLTGWRTSNTEGFSIKDGALYDVAKTHDPILWSPEVNLDAKSVTSIKVTLSVSNPGKMQVFYVTNKDTTWNERKTFEAVTTEKDKLIEVEFDTTKSANWADTITKIRIDPMMSAGEFSVQSIKFCGIADTSLLEKVDVVVDSVPLELPEQYIQVTDKEFYVAGDPNKGVMSANNFYYEWNRHSGTLLLKTGTDTEFIFTVGSNKANVNGSDKALAKPFYTFDGMPVLPMRFILDTCKIKYTVSGKCINITHRNVNFDKEENQRVPYEYEFNIPDDLEGWTPGAVSYYVDGGVLVMSSTEAKGAATGYDPKLLHNKLDIPAGKYSKIVIRMKYELKPNATEKVDDSMCVYFATSTEGGLDEVKKCVVKFSDGVKDKDGYMVYTFDMSSNAKWTGTVTTVRFDPSNNNGVYTVDYIRIS